LCQITAVSVYSDEMSLREARDLFFARSSLGPDGGYSSRWVRVETKPLPFYFPNWPARIAAARLHDLHHIAADYQTDWRGEAEIAAWEIASGCGSYYAAWLLNLGGWGAGLVLAPRRTLRAFMRGRSARTNLYHRGFDETQLDRLTVGELRNELGLREPARAPTAYDVGLFLFWSAPAAASWLPGPLIIIAMLWWLLHG
jgi:hypothetical protein